MDKVKKTDDAKKGGLLVGKSHAEGGMPAIVVDTGQPIEVEGGEVIINKEASKKYWKELSKINQSAGNGVPIPPPADFSGDVNQYNRGGKVSISDLKIGTQMELEHTDTIKKYMKDGMTVEQVAKSIAKDHLKENPNYYKILKKLKLAKGGEVVCRSCGDSWGKHRKDVGMNVYQCVTCGSENSKFYASKKAGNGMSVMSLLERDPETGMTVAEEAIQLQQQPFNLRGKFQFIKKNPELLLLKKGGQLTLPQKEEIYAEWEGLVNMTRAELKSFYNSEEGKKAGLTPAKAKELKISHGRESARWIMKMLDMPYTQWSDEMWDWAQKQINFIKRMSGNKGSLYDAKGKKTRKHTSLLIWGHNPEKFEDGGVVIDAEIVGGDAMLNPQIGMAVIDADSTWLDFDSVYYVTDVAYENSKPTAVRVGLDKYNTSGISINEFRKRYRPATQEEVDRSKQMSASWFAKGGRTKNKNEGGDCYETAGNFALKRVNEIKGNKFIGTPYVVHAEVMGQGAIAGLRYGHAWIEDDVFVYDFSNGREIIIPKVLYYHLGQIQQKKPKYYKYTFNEARSKMLESGHYGCWDLKTESGL